MTQSHNRFNDRHSQLPPVVELFAVPVFQTLGCRLEAVSPPHDELVLLYKPLSGTGLVSNLAGVDEFVKHLGSDEPLLDTKFLSKEGLPPAPTSDPTITLSLLLTDRCNLSCGYCYNKGLTNHGATMHRDLVLRAVEATQRQFGRLDRLLLHGIGEPTQAMAPLEQAVQAVRKLSQDITVSLGTNGVFSSEVLEQLVSLVDTFVVSLDGDLSTHSRQRPSGFSNGHQQVVANCKALVAAGKEVGIRMTVDGVGLKEMVKNVRYVADAVKPSSIQVEPDYALTAGASGSKGADFARSFVENFINARSFLPGSTELTFSSARPKVLTTEYCTASVRGVTVGPTGDLLPCFEQGARGESPRFAPIGRLEGKTLQWDDSHRRRFAHWRLGLGLECGDCFCRWHCAGDCPARRDSGLDRTRCLITRALTLDSLLRRFASH